MNGQPIVFQSAEGACLGWFHAGASPRRGVAVVMCRPLGYEALCSYRTYTQLAQTLSDAGFDVMRFDYHGTGDSAGSDEDPQRVDAWLASIDAAIEQTCRLCGATRIALFGTRFGGTLAVQAAVQRGGVDTLMLWAPCASGRTFVREMRAADAARGLASSQAGLEGLGTLFTPETLDAMSALDATKAPVAPAKDILIIGRDDVPAVGPLPERFRALGAEVTYTVWPGYAGMMAEPHEAVLAPQTLESITNWLASVTPAQAGVDGDSNCAADPSPTTPACAGVTTGAVVESMVNFGADGGLFGILAEPNASVAPLRTDTAVLMLNVGGNYRIGPNRNYVKAARDFAAAGYRALRFDVSGIGDSRLDKGFSSANMYRDWATVDVSAAIDMLAARGCRRFFLMGICSGSYLAFQTALQDTRVTGIMLMNPRLLEWNHEMSGPWQSSMQQYYKSTRFYRRALLRSEMYARLLRGKIDVRGIARRMAHLAGARIARAWAKLRGHPPHEGVLAKFRHLSRRGVETLLVMSEQDDGLDYMQFHLGTDASRMRGHKGFRMVLIPDADHTFSTVACQRALIGVLRDHLNNLHALQDVASYRMIGVPDSPAKGTQPWHRPASPS
ncbi:MAG TPA: alpha/beta fold hydrolase [Ramlibacter sp.]|nr:alpha/beta fold hydrolase [Ramlibacter sp.]